MEDFLNKYKNILELIGYNQNILDVGCSYAPLGKELKQKSNRIVGIEINKNNAEKAKEYYDEVIVNDAELIITEYKLENKFNIILYSEIFEHLKNPIDVLRNYKKFLKDNGFIIAVIPNVAFWRNRCSLLLGNWDYNTEGILDKTHLRFYTLKTAKCLIQEAGYAIIDIKILFHTKIGLNFLKSLLANIFPGLFGLLFIIKAQPIKQGCAACLAIGHEAS